MALLTGFWKAPWEFRLSGQLFHLWQDRGWLIVNYTGYPYWMLVTSGALQSIPTDIYEAAEVDGAMVLAAISGRITTLLLVSVGPLMIASFIFNFQ